MDKNDNLPEYMRVATNKVLQKMDQVKEQKEELKQQQEDTTPDPNKKTFSPAQVAQHKSHNDCWIILDGKVYDVTSYVPDHPGGSMFLLESSGDGKDHAEDFEDAEHSKTARNMLQKFYIGDVAS